MHEIQFTLQKIAARLKLVAPAINRETAPVAPLRLLLDDDQAVGPDVDDDAWTVVAPGAVFSGHRQNFTLRTWFTVPASWTGRVAIEIDLGRSSKLEALAFLYGPEALAFIDGVMTQGIDVNHTSIELSDTYRDGRDHLLALGGWTGIRDERYDIGGIRLVRIDTPTYDFVGLARLAYECVVEMPAGDLVRARLITALDRAFGLLDLRQTFDAAFYASVPAALAQLQLDVASAGPPQEGRVVGVGHAHLDLAWLWTLSQTRKKGARTFSTVLGLMDRFPEFRFSQSQPQLYEFIRESQPEMFERIRQRVADGSWEPFGGMWVESDCNLAGGESLARQFVLGRQFYREWFGTDGAPILWLPDVFGYAWQLPQLIAQAGLRYFVTAKMSWNQYNRVPYDRFQWRGLDGTSILTYLITTTKPGWWGATYSADLTPAEIVQTRKSVQQPELHDELMIAYGHGDGGGGPTARMIEDARLLERFPGMPRVKLGKAQDFLSALDDQAGANLPVWNGELYLELHRGTYTSQAANKRANRKMEFLLHDAEFLAAWSAIATGSHYPHDHLRAAWRLLCLNQFHDIIPGSSIAEVYADSARDYAEIERIAADIREVALTALDGVLPSGATLVAYNPTSFARSEVVETVAGPLLVTDVPAYGYRVLEPNGQNDGNVTATTIEGASFDASAHAEAAFVLEHEGLRAEFDRTGDLVRLFHKAGRREVLAAGSKANVWQLFEDRPLDWDAWDIDAFYEASPIAMPSSAEIEVVEAGGLRGALSVRRRFENSWIEQRIVLRQTSNRLDFETIIDWRERHKLLKVAFPVDVLSPVATFDIQWGHVERPTHRNTSWDWARFETCAHKWVDLSEGDFGVSLLNDCKYGHDIHDNVIRLTALKGATFPDPDADLGEHRFTYALLPHAGADLGETIREAYALNDPLIMHRPGSSSGAQGSQRASLFEIDNPHAVVETVKLAEDGKGLVIRAYESGRTRGSLAISPNFPVVSAALCDLHETPVEPLPAEAVTVALTPFRIVTIRLNHQPESENV